MAGASLKAIQELLGHRDVQTTMRYAHLAPSSLREAVSLLGARKEISTNFGQYTVNTFQHPTNISSPFKTLTPELSLFKATGEH